MKRPKRPQIRQRSRNKRPAAVRNSGDTGVFNSSIGPHGNDAGEVIETEP